MSFIGKQPSVDSLKFTPLSADPTTPYEGMMQYSDGTARAEGPWIYQNGVWAQFSTGAAITIINSLTLTPQAADPGTPAIGMLFSSDGTSRAAGLWYYNSSSQWTQITGVRYQEFNNKVSFTVRAASTANVLLASQVENGDSFGGVTLSTNDLVLLKNQTTATENGVYVVQASGAPVRSGSYDTATELTYAKIFVSSGTNASITYWQTAVLASLATNQVWGTTPPTYFLTVPEGVYEIQGLAIAGGGGGGAGGGSQGGGGDGGAGATPALFSQKVTPGQVLSIDIGVGGRGGNGNSVAAGSAGSNGTATSLTGTNVNLYFPGGAGGAGGTNSQAGFGPGNSSYTVNFTGVNAGRGGGGSRGNASVSGEDAYRNFWTSTPATGGGSGAGTPLGGGGGGGGSAFGAGSNGAGGANSGTSGASDVTPTNYGAGGGGGGGNWTGASPGGGGATGADGYIRISWS